ncbi:MAG: hypothetical protein K8F91_14595 [Candidatus Obscuribacterales bacterium]|nr:hypothetical protein [Candidatus Obscuribacterales bacterium]
MQQVRQPAPAPVQPQIANNPLTSAPLTNNPPSRPAEAPKSAPPRTEEENKPEVGPQDRRGNDRRRSRERRSFSNLVDERDSGEMDAYQGQHAGPPAGGMMAIMVTAFIGALFKLWYLVTLFTQYDFQSAQMLIFDQVATLVVFVGLIIFASSAKKS